MDTTAKTKKIRFIVKCMNDKCNNFNQELDAATETCSLCGEPVTKIETKVNPTLSMIAIIAAIAAPIIFMFGFWPWFWSGLAIAPAGVVVGILSKSKAAVIVSILGVLVTAFVVLYFFVLM